MCIVVSTTIVLLQPLTYGDVKKASATSMLPSNLTSAIASIHTVLNPSSSNHSLLVVQSPFYEAHKGLFMHKGKITGQVVSNSEPPQIQVSATENGTVKGIGNVTNLETWLETYRTPTIINGLGHGILTTKDGQMATWVAHDMGRTNVNTGTTFKGIMFFNTNSTGKLAFLNNLEGLFITHINTNGSRLTNIWEWK